MQSDGVCPDHLEHSAEEKPEKSWVEWVKDKMRSGNEGEDGYERDRGRSLPEEQKQQEKERGGRDR